MGGWKGRRKEGRMDGKTQVSKDGRMEGWKDGRMEEWVDLRMEGRKDGRTEEWTRTGKCCFTMFNVSPFC